MLELSKHNTVKVIRLATGHQHGLITCRQKSALGTERCMVNTYR
jgi:hypothetical protein